MSRSRKLVFAVLCSLPLALAPRAAPAGCDWALFPTVDPYPIGNQLVAVSGTSKRDVWEVGASFGASRWLGYALHWNGTTWTTYSESNPSTYGGQYSGVAAVAPNDAWAVGLRFDAPQFGQPRAAIEHWNGSAFSVVAAPDPPGEQTFLYGVTALNARNLWAVGGAAQSASALQESYIVHWDGTRWNRVSSPNVANRNTNLVAIAGSSPSDIWSVGDYYYGPSGSEYRTLAEHWNGERWSIVPTPNVGAHFGHLNAVVALAPDDAWAIGDYVNGSSYAPLTEHWDGRAWRIVASPDPGGALAFLFGVTAVSPHAVWAVGEIAPGPGRVSSYTLRWDGVSWRVIRSAYVPDRSVTLLYAVTLIPGDGLWAVGGDGDAARRIVIDTVTERRCVEESSRLLP